jgi:hypothetical protein
VAADGDAWPVQVAERLAIGRLNHLVDVNAGLASEPGELVGQRDIDVAVSGLG